MPRLTRRGLVELAATDRWKIIGPVPRRVAATELSVRRIASKDMHLTMILVMSETLPLSSVKTHLSEIVDRVEGEHDRVVVTRNGKPAAVLISHEDLEGLEETLTIMSDPALMAQVREGEQALADGDPGATLAELRAALDRRRDAAA